LQARDSSSSSGCLAPGIERVGGGLTFKHRHIVRQQRVQSLWIDRLVTIARHLPPRVHATVGASSDRHDEWLAAHVAVAEDRAQGSLELTLHGAQPRLACPAHELRPVVLQRQL
jgi:hypothetical protein